MKAMDDMISCKEMVDLIMDYLDGSLDSVTSEGFDMHIDGCIDCHAFLNTYRKTASLMNKLSCKEIPEELRTRISNFLRERGTF